MDNKNDTGDDLFNKLTMDPTDYTLYKFISGFVTDIDDEGIRALVDLMNPKENK